MSLHYDRELDEQCGERDGECGVPRASTRVLYRRGYDRGLTRKLRDEFPETAPPVRTVPGDWPGWKKA